MPEATHPVHAIDLILHKRSGGQLSDLEIRYLIQAVVAHGARSLDGDDQTPTPGKPHISDAQLGALLMAIYQHGLSPRELAILTEAMRTSGEVFDSAPLHAFIVDKHSTGGVGDKTSLLIAPIVAAAGLASSTPSGTPSICVPMISGRSLGHTGGTLDKLETIPGFDSQLSLARFAEVLRATGAALIGQTPTLVPADRILYALRDHTGTVESPYLLATSIMSKKLAESLNALVLDVKVGSGAFLPTLAEARHLAQLMVETGTRAGTRTVALLTAMDQPLGRFAGNWLEVRECVDILQGRPHPLSADLIDLSSPSPAGCCTLPTTPKPPRPVFSKPALCSTPEPRTIPGYKSFKPRAATPPSSITLIASTSPHTPAPSTPETPVISAAWTANKSAGPSNASEPAGPAPATPSAPPPESSCTSNSATTSKPASPSSLSLPRQKPNSINPNT